MAKFVKGQSGNPGGKSAMDLEFFKALKKAAAKSLDRICEIAASPNDENYFKANIWIAERAYGKAAQGIELTGENGGPLIAVIKDG